MEISDHTQSPARLSWLIALVPLTVFIVLLLAFPRIESGDLPALDLPWVPSLGITFELRVDGLSHLFGLLISGVGFLVIGYSGSYRAHETRQGWFHALMLFFFVAMMGVVMSPNLLTMYVFWELTTIASFLLIGFNYENERARKSAHQALVITVAGGLSMLAGLILLGMAGGSFHVSELAASRDQVLASPLFPAALGLLLIGVFAKSAQFPVHFWLPNAMVAPTPVSAYLHSAAMVKAGVYLLFRLYPIMGGTIEWYGVLTSIGLVTMLMGAIVAFLSIDLKRVLAFSTMSALGMIVLFIGAGSPEALTGALVFTVAHALYKCALFLVVGAVNHAAGGRDIDRLRGLARAMPATAVAAALAALSLAGFGPVLSFMGKEKLLSSAIHLPFGEDLITLGLFLTSALFTAIALLVAYHPFYGRREAAPEPPEEPPASIWLPPLALGSAGILLGLFPSLLEPLVKLSLRSSGIDHTPGLALWQGFTVELGLSMLAVLLGTVIYMKWTAAIGIREKLRPWLNWGSERAFESGMRAISGVADLQRRWIERGQHRFYLTVMVLVVFGGSGSVLLSRENLGMIRLAGESLQWIELSVVALILIGILSAVFIRSRIGAIISLGSVGYGVALIFVGFSAPDLAMTQVLYETILIIMLVPVLGASHRIADSESGAQKLITGAVAIGSGVVVTLLVLLTMGEKGRPIIGEFFLRVTETETHGRNIVNMILVDFRALDTIGEVAVFSVAAIGVYALMRLRARGSRT